MKNRPGPLRVPAAESVIASPPRQPDGSIEGVDRIRHCETERSDDPDQLAATFVCLGHHRARKHGKDRAGGERQDERDGGG